jgi:hypothetical protein
MNLPLTLTLTLALCGQAPQAEESKEERAARLEVMKASLAKYDVHSLEQPKVPYRLQVEPVLRFTNPVGVTKDGAIFLWLGEDGRPEAAVQIFLMRSGLWGSDFTTLSKGPLSAEKPQRINWRPKRGIEYKPVPGAPKPATSPDQRLRQMKDLVEGFEVSDDFREKGWQALRPMSKPFARFGKAGTSTVDGALFCYALGTDPEAFLMLEALDGKDGPAWNFAFAPQTIYALKASWKGAEVWNVPLRGDGQPDDPFFNLVLRNLE